MATEVIRKFILLEGDLGRLYTEDYDAPILLSVQVIGELIKILVSDRDNTPSIEVSDQAGGIISVSDYNN
jgi:hypothetical protein